LGYVVQRSIGSPLQEIDKIHGRAGSHALHAFLFHSSTFGQRLRLARAVMFSEVPVRKPATLHP
jgi:hypothetical protein